MKLLVKGVLLFELFHYGIHEMRNSEDICFLQANYGGILIRVSGDKQHNLFWNQLVFSFESKFADAQ